MPDRVTYNTVIDAYATNARPKRVSGDPSVSQPSRSQLNRDDSNSHHDPDSDSDSPEFDPSSEEDPCDAAFRLLREMRSPKVRVEPCLKTWTSVLSACARSGDPTRAILAFDRMRASGISPDTKAWTALMQSHAARGDLGATAEVYWRMRTEGVAPNEGTLGAALAAGRVGGGDVSKLIAIYRDMRALDVRPNNRGFRQLTEMWVDQAFDDVDEHGGGDVRDGSDGVTHARVHPNFMLADLLGPNVDGPAESIASRAVARSGDASGNGSGEESGNLIDVHGLSVPETRAAVLSVLQALLERRRSGLGVHGNLVIVTGVGRSTPSEPPLRDAVVKLAGDLKLEIDIAPTNPGRLVAKEATLLTWLDRDRNETWSKERELVASVPTRKIRTGNRTDKTGGGRRGGNGGQRRYVGRRGRGAPRPTPTTGGLDSALRQWLDENSDESDSTTD
jgi:pentatricopeptide repeat protein